MTQTGNVLTQLKNSQFDRQTMPLAWVVKETGSGISGLELREAAPDIPSDRVLSGVTFRPLNVVHTAFEN